MTNSPVHVIGGGLAGSEASWQIAEAGVPVVLHEMRPVRSTEAHVTDTLAELVCSNSFRSDDALNNAVGLLHEEMRRCFSLILQAADAHKVPAGGALAVDREGFARAVQAALEGEPLVEIRREEVVGLPPDAWDSVVIATGARYRRLNIPGQEALEGAGIYYAATELEARRCFEKEVIVVGGGNSAGQAAMFLSQRARCVHRCHRAAPAGLRLLATFLCDGGEGVHPASPRPGLVCDDRDDPGDAAPAVRLCHQHHAA